MFDLIAQVLAFSYGLSQIALDCSRWHHDEGAVLSAVSR